MLRKFWLWFAGERIDFSSAFKIMQEHYENQNRHFCESMQAKIDSRDEEIKRLTNLILTEHGVIHPEVQVREREGNPLPISSRRRWEDKRRQLERDDAKKQADSVAEMVRRKNEEAVNASEVG